MFIDAKISRTIANDKGVERKVWEHYLIENAVNYTDAEVRLFQYAVSKGIEIIDHELRAIRMHEVVNTKREGEISFKAKVRETYLLDDGRTKKMRYNVILWAKDKPDADNVASVYAQTIGNMEVEMVGESNFTDQI